MVRVFIYSIFNIIEFLESSTCYTFGMKNSYYLQRIKGFTLIEIMTVVAIISIMATVIGVNALQSGQQSRDAKRQADIRTLQSAIELYKNKNGRYPAQCTPANAGTAQGWSGQLGTDYACTGSDTQYIVGLAPEFIPVLPIEKKLNGTDSGYVYRTNAAGTVYKLKAHRTVESEVVDYNHPLKPCDIRVPSTITGSLVVGSTNPEVIGWCGRVRVWTFASGVLAPPDTCKSVAGNISFTGSYGVWGGFLPKRGVPADPTRDLFDTTEIICR